MVIQERGGCNGYEYRREDAWLGIEMRCKIDSRGERARDDEVEAQYKCQN